MSRYMSKTGLTRTFRVVMGMGLSRRLQTILVGKLKALTRMDEMGVARSYYDYLELNGLAPELTQLFTEHFGQCSYCGGPMFGISTDSRDIYPTEGFIPAPMGQEVKFCSDRCGWNGATEVLTDRIRMDHPELNAEATYANMGTALFFSEVSTPKSFNKQVVVWGVE
jgi:hypothetical protein